MVGVVVTRKAELFLTTLSIGWGAQWNFNGSNLFILRRNEHRNSNKNLSLPSRLPQLGLSSAAIHINIVSEIMKSISHNSNRRTSPLGL